MPFIPVPRAVVEARYQAYLRAIELQKQQQEIAKAQAWSLDENRKEEERLSEEDSRNRRASLRGGRSGVGTTILSGGGQNQSLIGTAMLTGSRTLG